MSMSIYLHVQCIKSATCMLLKVCYNKFYIVYMLATFKPILCKKKPNKTLEALFPFFFVIVWYILVVCISSVTSVSIVTFLLPMTLNSNHFVGLLAASYSISNKSFNVKLFLMPDYFSKCLF